MSEISIEDFQKVEIRAGKVLEVSEVEGSEKLLRLKVDFGELGVKQVLSGIKEWYKPEDLEQNTYPFVVNLSPREIMGEMSEAMILAATSCKSLRGEAVGEDIAVLFKADRDIEPGSTLH